MKQLNITILLVLLMSITTSKAFAHDFEVDGIYYKITSYTQPYTVEVTYKGNSSSEFSNEYLGVVSIPSTVSYNAIAFNVTSIGEEAFYGCSGLSSVIIGNGVTNIGQYAFVACKGLTSVTIPNSVTSIESDAFWGCSGLQKVIVKDIAAWCKISFPFYWANPLYIAHHLYSDENTEITNLVIPNSVTSIGNYAFHGCSGLSSVTIPNSVTSIGDRAFWGCSGLTSVEIPNSVTSIGDYAFNGCSGLSSIEIPNSVTSIGVGAFSGTAWENYLPDGLVYAGKVAYKYKGTMPNNTTIKLKEGTTQIYNGVFYGCSGLTSIEIPNSVTSIGEEAFEGCSSLISIEIPNSVTGIGTFAFRDCSSLTSIEIPNSVTSIGMYAFYGCSGLTSVIIGNGVTSIGDGAFAGCLGLTSVEIPNSVTSIGTSAFSGCSGLKKVIVKDIAAWCEINFGNEYANPLYYAKHLYRDKNTEITNLVIPDGVTSIGEEAFEGCLGLTSVEIPNSVTSIGTSAFSGCDKLETLSLGCTSIGTWFQNLSTLKNLVIGENVSSIADNAFSGCTILMNVISKVSMVFNLPENAFSDLTFNNATLYIPKGTTNKYSRINYWTKFLFMEEGDGPVLSGIKSVENDQTAEGLESGNWYTLDGRRLSGKPTKRGIYIVNGKKRVVK